MPRDHYIEIVREANQPPIKHPMNGTREGDAVLDGIRSVLFNWLDMRRLDFSSSAAVDELEPGQCTSFVIRIKDMMAENPISQRSGDRLLNPQTFEVGAMLEFGRG